MILAAEDGPADTIIPGLLACGADLDRITIIEGVEHDGKRNDFTLRPEHVTLLRTRLQQSRGAIKLIIIDPVASFVGRARVDDHRAAELRLVLDPLSALAEELGATILLIAHLNKGTGEAIDRIAGSAAYRDAVRAAYLAAEDPEDETRRLMIPVKENLAGFDRTTIPYGLERLTDAEANSVMCRKQFDGLNDEDRALIRDQLRRVRFDSPVKMDANEVTSAKAKKPDKNKVQRCVDWLRAFLVEFAHPSKEIQSAGEANGFTFDNIKEAKAVLKAEGLHHSNTAAPGRSAGEWWSGFGSPLNWTLRPTRSPDSPHSPHSSLSPLSPVRKTRTGESGESGDTGETGGAKLWKPQTDSLPD